MATANLNNNSVQISTGRGSIVIVENIESIRGVRTLDVTGFTHDVIETGHVIIHETATDEYKQIPVDARNTAYAALPPEHTCAGILIATILTAKPFAGTLVRGIVNRKAAHFEVPVAAKEALPLIIFRAD